MDPQKEPAFHYITLATKPHRVLENLQNRVNQNGESLIVLGGEENRLIGWEGAQNFGLKLREVSNFINRVPLHPNDIVLFTDAYDVAYCGDRTEIVRRFQTFHKPIVFGAEKFCNPDPHMAANYKNENPPEHEFPYLNSGLFIGRVWAIQCCISNYRYEDRDDDQRYWTKQFLENSELIELDYYNKVFLNTAGMEENEFTYQKEENRATYKKRTPLFVHVNGPDKRMIEDFL